MIIFREKDSESAENCLHPISYTGKADLIDKFHHPSDTGRRFDASLLEWNSVANLSVKTSYPCRPYVRGEVQNLCQRGIHSVSGTEYLCPPLTFGYSPARKLHRGCYLWYMSIIGNCWSEGDKNRSIKDQTRAKHNAYAASHSVTNKRQRDKYNRNTAFRILQCKYK